MWLEKIFPQTSEVVPQLLATLTVTLNSITDGMQFGWTAPIFPILRSNSSTTRITERDETWLEITYLAAGIVGLPITIYLIDKVGRIRLVFVSASLALVSWTIIFVATTVDFYYCSKFISGLQESISYVAIPMYISEIANQNIRGFLVGYVYLMVLFGVLVIYSVVPFCSYYVPSAIAGTLLLLQLGLLSFLPESPYFLLIKGERNKAKLALSRLRAKSEKIEEELDSIAKYIEGQKEGNGSIRALFVEKNSRKALCMVALLSFMQQFSGIPVLVMNITTLLIEANSVYMRPEITSIVFAGIMLLSAAACVLTVDRFGRKTLLVTSGITTGVCLFTLFVYLRLKYLGIDVDRYSWIPVLAVMTYAVTFETGLGFLPEIVTAEVFSSKTKAIGMTLGSVFTNVFSLLAVIFYQYLALSFGTDVPLFVFAAVACLSAVCTVFFVPETRGKSLEDIQLMLKT